MDIEYAKKILDPVLKGKDIGWQMWCEGYVSALAGAKVITEEEFEDLIRHIQSFDEHEVVIEYINTVGDLKKHLEQFSDDKILIFDGEGDTYSIPKSAITLWNPQDPSSPVASYTR